MLKNRIYFVLLSLYILVTLTVLISGQISFKLEGKINQPETKTLDVLGKVKDSLVDTLKNGTENVNIKLSPVDIESNISLIDLTVERDLNIPEALDVNVNVSVSNTGRSELNITEDNVSKNLSSLVSTGEDLFKTEPNLSISDTFISFQYSSKNIFENDEFIIIKKCTIVNKYFDTNLNQFKISEDFQYFKNLAKQFINKTDEYHLLVLSKTLERGASLHTIQKDKYSIDESGSVIDITKSVKYNKDNYCLDLRGQSIATSEMVLNYFSDRYTENTVKKTDFSMHKCCDEGQVWHKYKHKCIQRPLNMTFSFDLQLQFNKYNTIKDLVCEFGSAKPISANEFYINKGYLCDHLSCLDTDQFCLGVEFDDITFRAFAFYCRSYPHFIKCCEQGYVFSDGNCIESKHRSSDFLREMLSISRTFTNDYTKENCFEGQDVELGPHLWQLDGFGDNLIIKSDPLELTVQNFCIEDTFDNTGSVFPVAYACKNEVGHIVTHDNLKLTTENKLRKCCPENFGDQIYYFSSITNECEHDNYNTSLQDNEFLENDNFTYPYFVDFPQCDQRILYRESYPLRRTQHADVYAEFQSETNLGLFSGVNKCPVQDISLEDRHYCMEYTESPTARFVPRIFFCANRHGIIQSNFSLKYTSTLLGFSCVCLFVAAVYLLTAKVRRGAMAVRKNRIHFELLSIYFLVTVPVLISGQISFKLEGKINQPETKTLEELGKVKDSLVDTLKNGTENVNIKLSPVDIESNISLIDPTEERELNIPEALDVNVNVSVSNTGRSDLNITEDKVSKNLSSLVSTGENLFKIQPNLTISDTVISFQYSSKNIFENDEFIIIRKCYRVNEYYNTNLRKIEVSEDFQYFKNLAKQFINKTDEYHLLVFAKPINPRLDGLSYHTIQKNNYSIDESGSVIDITKSVKYNKDNYCLDLTGQSIAASEMILNYFSDRYTENIVEKTDFSMLKCCDEGQVWHKNKCIERPLNMTFSFDSQVQFSKYKARKELDCTWRFPKEISADEFYINKGYLCDHLACFDTNQFCLDVEFDDTTFRAMAIYCPSYPHFIKCCEQGYVFRDGNCIESKHLSSDFLREMLSISRTFTNDYTKENCLEGQDVKLGPHLWQLDGFGDNLIIKSDPLELTVQNFCIEDTFDNAGSVFPVAYACKNEVDHIVTHDNLKLTTGKKLRKCCPENFGDQIYYFSSITSECEHDNYNTSLQDNEFLEDNNFTYPYFVDFPQCDQRILYRESYPLRRTQHADVYAEFQSETTLGLFSGVNKCPVQEIGLEDRHYCMEYTESPTARFVPRIFFCANRHGIIQSNFSLKYTSTLLGFSCVCLFVAAVYLLTAKVRRGAMAVRKISTLAGKIQVSFVCSNLVGLTALTFAQVENHMMRLIGCYTLTGIIQYFNLCAFHWNTSICLESLLLTIDISISKNIRYFLHSLWAWGVPSLITMTTYLMHMYRDSMPCWVILPNIGEKCFLAGAGMSVYFYVPILFTLCANIFLIFGAKAIRNIRLKKLENAGKKLAGARPSGMRTHETKDSKAESIRIILWTGATWFMEVLIHFLARVNSIWVYYFGFIPTTINCLRGVGIFYIIVLTPENRKFIFKYLETLKKRLGVEKWLPKKVFKDDSRDDSCDSVCESTSFSENTSSSPPKPARSKLPSKTGASAKKKSSRKTKSTKSKSVKSNSGKAYTNKNFESGEANKDTTVNIENNDKQSSSHEIQMEEISNK